MLKDDKYISEPQAILALIVAVMFCITWLSLMFELGPFAGLAVNYDDSVQPHIASIFKTPIDKMTVFSGHCNHGWIDFEVFSPAEPLVVDKSFLAINLDSGALGTKIGSWMTHCYFHAHSEFLGKPNEHGDIWVYEDNACSRAFVTIEYAGSVMCGRYSLGTDFAKIFKPPFDKQYFKIGQYYITNDQSCFEVFSIDPLIPMVLQNGFQRIDPQLFAVEFPPGQKKEPWMTRCYYYYWPASFLIPKQEAWIFTNNALEHAYVILKFPKEHDLYKYYGVSSMLHFPYSKMIKH